MDRSEKDQLITISQENLDEMKETLRGLSHVAVETRMLIDCPLLPEMIKRVKRDPSQYIPTPETTEEDLMVLLQGLIFFIDSLDRRLSEMNLGDAEVALKAKMMLEGSKCE